MESIRCGYANQAVCRESFDKFSGYTNAELGFLACETGRRNLLTG